MTDRKPPTPPQPAQQQPEQQKPPEQPVRDTTHGHPGLPPKDYKQPREK